MTDMLLYIINLRVCIKWLYAFSYVVNKKLNCRRLFGNDVTLKPQKAVQLSLCKRKHIAFIHSLLNYLLLTILSDE